jgi:hypothetical protein
VCYTQQQATEDEQSRDEKIRRASFDIKTAHAASPGSNKKLPRVAVAAADKRTATPQQDVAGSLLFVGGGEQQQDHSSHSPTKQQEGQDMAQQLVLTPQEVLQELLGDMYVDQPRLSMGEEHGKDCASYSVSCLPA